MRKLPGVLSASLLGLGLASAVGLTTSGCGGMYYAVAVTSASSRVEEARVLGAEQLAPYEYYYAQEHLEQAQFEAAEASYSDAAHSPRRPRSTRPRPSSSRASRGRTRATSEEPAPLVDAVRLLSDRPRSRRRGRLVVFATLLSCAEAPLLRGQIAGLHDDVVKAEKNGARRCAPRELAMAQSHLEFAATELDQGEVSNAAHHLAIAEQNAHAALAESPEARCVEHAAPPPPEPEAPVGSRTRTRTAIDILDSKDQCILEPEDVDGYQDDDGCPEPDNDNDGIPDAVDKCPNKPEDFDGFQDDDGCPDPDNDKDTVLDVDDFCPNTPGQPGGPRPGCPGPSSSSRRRRSASRSRSTSSSTRRRSGPRASRSSTRSSTC